ncbi:MAG: 5-formyltetrahydrofolate cyclo-ligase [Candidatus Ancillula trichonymphae]|jgi:5-formyltetrahydrofolate cyclo-ligase|nr:5-formyltetrahydrofolate cyclo-ligase [Candidatus Ancillula trichonymphae]
MENNTSIEDVKSKLRSEILERRKLNSKAQRLEYESLICEVALLLDEVADANVLALYVSTEFEPGTEKLLQILKLRNKTILLPVLEESLTRGWARYSSREDLVIRKLGRPPEPSSLNLGEEALRSADVLLVPALGVDTSGTRIGHGGGWYDRALLSKKDDVKIFALVFSSEVFDAETNPLPHEAHDVKVNGYVTEKEFVRIKS